MYTITQLGLFYGQLNPRMVFLDLSIYTYCHNRYFCNTHVVTLFRGKVVKQV